MRELSTKAKKKKIVHRYFIEDGQTNGQSATQYAAPS